MTDPNGWPDDVRKTLQYEIAMAGGNMSGMEAEAAAIAALTTLAPFVAAREAAAAGATKRAAVAMLRARHKGLEHLREHAEAQHAADEIEARLHILEGDALAALPRAERRKAWEEAAQIADGVEQQNRLLDCAEASERDCLLISGRIDGASVIAAALRARAEKEGQL
jgi:hypothetical protein